MKLEPANGLGTAARTAVHVARPSARASAASPLVIPTLLLLFFLSEGVRYVVLNPGGQGSTVVQRDPFAAPLQWLLYAGTALAIASSWREIARVLSRAPFLALFLVALPASTFWSVDAGVSIRSATALLAAAILGIWFELRFEARTQLALMSVLFVSVIVLSIAFIAFLPEMGIEQSLHAGSWRGIFNHKNNLGRAMALAITVFIIHMRWAKGAFAFLVPSIVTAFAMLIGSNSATAPFILAAVCFLLAIDSLVRSGALSRLIIWLTGLLVAVSAFWLVATRLESILALFGRDASLSGRPLLWIAVLGKVSERPVLGYGVQAFWKGSRADYGAVDAVVGWSPGSAHNGFLDISVDLGAVGLALFLIGLSAAFMGAYRLGRESPVDATAIWPLAYLVLFSLSNLTESALLRPNSLYWFLYAGVVARTALKARPGSRLVPRRVPSVAT